MKLSKNKKRLLIVLSILLGIVLVFILSINLFVATIIEGKIKAALEKNDSEYSVKIRRVGGNIFFGNIRIRDVEIKPDTALLNKIKEGTSSVNTAFDIEIPLFRLVGVGIYKALVNSNIAIKTIEIKDAKIKIFKGTLRADTKEERREREPLRLDPDSIYLKNLKGISIGKIALLNNEFQLFDIEDDKQVLSNKLSEFEITDFYIRKYPDQKNLFYLDVNDLKIEVADEIFEMPGDNYKLSLSKVNYAIADSTLQIKGMKLKPKWKNKFKMAAQWKYTKEIFDIEIGDITLHSLHQVKLVRDGKIYIDSIIVNSLELDILKDKRYPFDESLRPKLPHQQLKNMSLPLYLGIVKIKNSKLVYQEKEEGSKDLMSVNLTKLNVDVKFATSVKDSILTEKQMTISLRAKFMDNPTLRVDFAFPLHTKSDVFYYSGSLGSAPLKTFNSASFPAIGAKFIKGKLNSITFNGYATETVSDGKMTFLYEDIQGEMVKKDQESKNKFMSWAANTVLRTSNPGKNGKTRIAVMHFERVMYKGFGNFMWKTLQSGIVNTISPTGKQIKVEDPGPTKKQQRQTNKAEQKQQIENSDEKGDKKKNKKDKKKNRKDRKKDK